MYFKKQTKCRFCESKKLIEYLDLGQHPPSNSFVLKKDLNNQNYYPLVLMLCKSCYLSQLSVVLDKKAVFDEYIYYSSSSKQLVEHYENTVNYNIKKYHLNKNDFICDIGSNDGVLISRYPNDYTNLIGIEPSKAFKQMKDKRVILINKFFNENLGKKIQKKFGKIKFISITNVYAHIDNIIDFNNGLKKIMSKDSVLMIEFPYLIDMIDKNFYDLIYHEHLSYLSLFPLNKLFKNQDMKIIDLKKVKIGASGPAMRIYLTLKESTRKISKKVYDQLNYEKQWGINKISKYKNYKNKVQNNKIKLIKLLNKLNKNNKLGGFSAPAKGNTLLNYCKLSNQTLIYISENNKDKIGKYTPGSNIKIISDDEFIKKKIKYALLLSWNYKTFFVKKSIFKKKGGKFIIPFPSPRIIK
tara:strand:+ start:328 stop:1563 length:1236 start_codon:yes stop_codon:yes gene_type:complete